MDIGVRVERLTGALLDRLTHHVHILEMNGDSFRLTSSRKRQKDKGRQNDLTKGGHRQRKSASAPLQPLPLPMLSSLNHGVFIQQLALFKPVPGPFLSRC
jgi:hypothetical protein